MTLGSNIKKIRKLRGLTQEELAKEIEISRSYLGDVENDRKNLSYKNVEKLAEKLDVSILYLNTGDDSYIDLGYNDNVMDFIEDNQSVFLAEFEKIAKETKDETLSEIESNGNIDMAKFLKEFNGILLRRFTFGEGNYDISFNGQPLTKNQLMYIGEILGEFTDIDVSKYTDDALEEMYYDFTKLLKEYKKE